MLVINSNPLISSMRQCSTYSKTNREDLPEGVWMLLVAPKVVDADNDNDTTNSAESDTDSDDSIWFCRLINFSSYCFLIYSTCSFFLTVLKISSPKRKKILLLYMHNIYSRIWRMKFWITIKENKILYVVIQYFKRTTEHL